MDDVRRGFVRVSAPAERAASANVADAIAACGDVLARAGFAVPVAPRLEVGLVVLDARGDLDLACDVVSALWLRGPAVHLGVARPAPDQNAASDAARDLPFDWLERGVATALVVLERSAAGTWSASLMETAGSAATRAR